MALTAEEKALLDSLTAKASEPTPGPEYTSLAQVVEYLVRTSDKFSANPDERTSILEYLDTLINPGAANESN